MESIKEKVKPTKEVESIKEKVKSTKEVEPIKEEVKPVKEVEPIKEEVKPVKEALVQEIPFVDEESLYFKTPAHQPIGGQYQTMPIQICRLNNQDICCV